MTIFAHSRTCILNKEWNVQSQHFAQSTHLWYQPSQCFLHNMSQVNLSFVIWAQSTFAPWYEPSQPSLSDTSSVNPCSMIRVQSTLALHYEPSRSLFRDTSQVNPLSMIWVNPCSVIWACRWVWGWCLSFAGAVDTTLIWNVQHHPLCQLQAAYTLVCSRHCQPSFWLTFIVSVIDFKNRNGD